MHVRDRRRRARLGGRLARSPPAARTTSGSSSTRPRSRSTSTRSSPSRSGSVGAAAVEIDPARLRRPSRPRPRAYVTLPAGHPQGYQDCFDAFVAETLRRDRRRGLRPTACRRSPTACAPRRITEAVLDVGAAPRRGWRSRREARPAHRLHAGALARGDRDLGRRARLRGARARGLAARSATGRSSPATSPPTASTRPRPSGSAARSTTTGSSSRRSPITTTTSTPTRPARGDPRAPARVHRRRRGARRRPGRHVHRPRHSPQRRREPARGRARAAAARRLRRRARRQADGRELRDGGLASRRLPGQPRLLAGALGVDVRARASTSTSTPRTCSGSGSTRSRRCEPYVDRVIHAHAKDAETFPDERNRYGFFGRLEHPRARSRGTWAGGASAFPASARSTSAGYVETLYEGGFDGVLSVEHEDPVWGGTAGEDRGAASSIAAGTLRPLVAGG